jgi:hypothetical protein
VITESSSKHTKTNALAVAKEDNGALEERKKVKEKVRGSIKGKKKLKEEKHAEEEGGEDAKKGKVKRDTAAIEARLE